DSNQRLRLEFNRSPASAIQFLEQRGFSDVKVLQRDILAMRLEACRDNDRFRFALRLDGRIFDYQRVGRCQQQVIGQDDVRRIARQQGLRNIEISQNRRGFQVFGCARNNERVALLVTRDGEIGSRSPAGRCAQRLTIQQVAAQLVGQGFADLEFDENQRRSPYRFRACQGGQRQLLEVSARGEITKRSNAGRCRQPIEVGDLPNLLAERGFDRVRVLDDTPPIFIVEACRQEDRLEMLVGARGRILEEKSVGECRDRVNPEALQALVQRDGFYKIKIERVFGGRFNVDACYGRQEYALTFNRFADLVEQKRKGTCRAMDFSEMAAVAAARGADRPQMVLEGCRNGTGIVARLDRSGVYTEREAPNARCR
ncbi:MAG: hypothetical protein AAFO77_10240, partial [Pseudomonadota bacterium]